MVEARVHLRVNATTAYVNCSFTKAFPVPELNPVQVRRVARAKSPPKLSMPCYQPRTGFEPACGNRHGGISISISMGSSRGRGQGAGGRGRGRGSRQLLQAYKSRDPVAAAARVLLAATAGNASNSPATGHRRQGVRVWARP